MMWILLVSLYLLVGCLVSIKIMLAGNNKITLGDLHGVFVITIMWPICFIVFLLLEKLDSLEDIVIFDFSKKVKK